MSGSVAAHDQAKLDAFLDGVMSDGIVVDGTIAHDSLQSAGIWRVREGITAALARSGYVYKYDVSVPLAELYDLVDEIRAALQPLGALTTAFGHLGDGNLHLNVFTPGKFERDDAVLSAIEPRIYNWIAARRGSISAEHGIGVMKPHYLSMSKTEPVIEVMRGLKTLLDPNGILNPAKVLPPRSVSHRAAL